MALSRYDGCGETKLDCVSPGGVCFDPRFVGGDGVTFYFHGRKDQDFCLVSDTNLHINAHFIGKRNPNLKRDFTWVQSLGIMFDNHKILVGAQKTSKWNDNVDHVVMSFDNTTISLPPNEGSKWNSLVMPSVTVTRTSNTNGVMVEVANNFKVIATVVPITAEDSRVHNYNITDEDCFAHLEIGFKFYNLTDIVDGVLGQTYRRDYVSKTKVNVPMPVMGGQQRFSTSSIFATDCSASRFGLNTNRRDGVAEYPILHCSSGMKGSGVVCKK
ncbi:unnamed protein product [Ilex paraguariensis]|uniref:Root cap n=1 Tax=Ilex paraguariensis TaxID=185542 RepID=A0ABC8V4R7_9AQUA